MDIKYIQRTARKTLSITINEKGEIIVKAPKNMNENQINAFINSKSKWIEKKVSEIKRQNSLNDDLYCYNKILFCGKKYAVIREQNLKEIHLSDDCIYIKKSLNFKKEVKQLEVFLKNKCIEIVGQRLKYFCNLMQLEPSEVKLTNAKRKWGSCNSEQVISFNWRMIMLPPSLIDYIIVHELAHLIEMNHSSSFWAIVSAVLPNLKDCRASLKKCNFILQQFREIPC